MKGLEEKKGVKNEKYKWDTGKLGGKRYENNIRFHRFHWILVFIGETNTQKQ